MESACTIAILGFSYGGNTAHDVAHGLAKAHVPGRVVELESYWFGSLERHLLVGVYNIDVDLVVTIDPVSQSAWDVSPARVGAYGFSKSANVDTWHNYYQRQDEDTGAGFLDIWGDSVSGADIDKQIVYPSRGRRHLQMVHTVAADVAKAIFGMASTRSSYGKGLGGYTILLRPGEVAQGPQPW